MPFDSEGRFTRVHEWEQDRANDISIDSYRMDEEFNNYADGLSESFLRDGRVPMTGVLNAGGFNIRNVSAGSLSSDAVNLRQLSEVRIAAEEGIEDLKKQIEELEISSSKDVEDLKNAENFTDEGKKNIINWFKPRYDRAISITSGYTVESTGVLYISCGGNNRSCWVDVDGVRTFSSNWDANYGSPDCSQIMVGIGSVITFRGVGVSLFPIEAEEAE